MSDHIDEFDRVFRDRLSGQTATPPPVVWENIQSTRTFGHVVANRITTNWGMFGTLLMLLLAGGSAIFLFGEEENINSNYNASLLEDYRNQQQLVNEVESLQQHNYNQEALYQPIAKSKTVSFDAIENHANEQKPEESSIEHNLENLQTLPNANLMASIEQAAFVRPILEDARLSAYIEELDGWESAKPKAFVRYHHMDEMNKMAVFTDELNQSPLFVELDYDYVKPNVERKTFIQRSSIVLSFTPQTVSKIMSAKYNLSSSYLKMREKTERTRLAYTFGAMLHYEMKKHKFIEVGLNFTQIYEEMHYEGEKRFSNQYDFLEIPMLLGYGDRNAKWGWEIKGGFGVQIHNNYKGYILKRLDEFGSTVPEPQFRKSKAQAVNNIINNNHSLSKNQARHEVLDLENEEENPFKTTGVVNIHLATGLVYYHSINTSFVITPSYRRSINSITKESALFNERISYMGISFGARLKF